METDSGAKAFISSAYITVVIPTRNRVELLARALASIRDQSFRNFEVIVIDDGSDESTRSRYQQLWKSLDERFILHFAQQSSMKPLGPSAARNCGISLARGAIVTFCDDDDFWTGTDHLKQVAEMFSKAPELDVYIANQIGVSQRGIEIESWFPSLKTASENGDEGTAGEGFVSLQALCQAESFAHLNILSLRKKLASEIGGFWEQVSYEEDRDFFWRAVDRSNRIYFNPRIIAQHNIPDRTKSVNQSTRHSIAERWLLSIVVCQHIAAFAKHPQISARALNYEGDLLRRLALHFSGIGRHVLGFSYARKALKARFSFKWCAYVTVLGLRALFMKKAT